MIGAGSLKALFGPVERDLGTVATGATITFPAGVSVVKMGSGGSHTKLAVPGAQVGDMVRIEATSAITLTSDVIDSSIATDALALGGDVTMAAYDRILLIRSKDSATGVYHWSKFLFQDLTA